MFFKTNFSDDNKDPNQSVAQILRHQISQLGDSRNQELQNYWNWNPKSDIKLSSSSNSSLNHNNMYYHEKSNTFTCMELAQHGDANIKVEVEVIISDLHDRVIHTCRQYCTELDLPVQLKQEPIQVTILETLLLEAETEAAEDHDRCLDTYVLFGGYANGMINSGLQKQLFEAFPDQMNNIRSQAMETGCQRGCIDEYDVNMVNQGEVFLAQPSLTCCSQGGGSIHFIACAAYPRKQTPSEEEHIRNTFHKGLDLAFSHFSMNHHTGGCRRSANTATATAAPHNNKSIINPTKRKIRILTHAMGSFVGHDNPAVFSWGLTHGLKDFYDTTTIISR